MILTAFAASAVFMMSGFAVVEAGFAHAKNAGDTLIKCLTGFGISVVTFLFAGRFIAGCSSAGAGEHTALVQALLCAAAVTIFSGAVTERLKFSVYCLCCFLISVLIYPLLIRFEYNGAAEKILSGIFPPFAVFPLTGGAAAFVGAKITGARLGKFDKAGNSHAIPGHNIPIAFFGTIVVILSWFVMSLLFGLIKEGSITTVDIYAENMLLGSCITGITTLFFTQYRYKKTDITLTMNGFLAGIVSASSCGKNVPAWSVCIISVLTGILIVVIIERIDRTLKVDDPAGFSTIFGLGSCTGLAGCALFSRINGLFFTGSLESLGIILVAALLTAAVVFIILGIFMVILKRTAGIRVKVDEEIEGLDLCEHGLVSSYFDFAYNINTTDFTDTYVNKVTAEERRDTVFKAEPYHYENNSLSETSLTKIEIITRKEQFEKLKTALNDIGVTGMTVIPVSGYGVQKGYNEYYRGIPMDVHLRAKICVQIVVAKIPVDDVVNTARHVLYTGHIGDGKIFIYSLNDVVRVRTGETGYAAMQGAASE